MKKSAILFFALVFCVARGAMAQNVTFAPPLIVPPLVVPSLNTPSIYCPPLSIPHLEVPPLSANASGKMLCRSGMSLTMTELGIGSMASSP